MILRPLDLVTAIAVCVNSLACVDSAVAQDGGWFQAPIVREFTAGGFGAPMEGAPAEIGQFGQLVGAWEARQELRARDGSWADVGPALWVWRYVLGGAGVEDLWFQRKSELPSYLGSIGHDYALIALRTWDVRTSRWRIAWASNGLGKTPGDDSGTSQATRVGDRIVVQSPGTGGGDQRITFHSIRPNSFEWVSEFSTDGGKTWREVMRVHAKRIR